VIERVIGREVGMAEGGRYLCDDICEGLLLLRLELHVEFPGVGGLVGDLGFENLLLSRQIATLTF
jgi:hypothetical protein